MKHFEPLFYGLRANGELAHISQVENGLNCNCYCPECGEILIAKQGEKNMHSFAHKSGKNCPSAHETSLHFLAKEIFSKGCYIALPAISYRKESLKEGYQGIEIVLHDKSSFVPDKVELEKKMDGFIPDIEVESNGIKLFIEIRVTHEVDEAKLERIKKRGISTIEIDLRSLERNISENDLRKYIESGEHTVWIFNKEIEEALRLSDLESNDLRKYPINVDVSSKRTINYICNPPCKENIIMILGKPAKDIEFCKQCPYFHDIQNNPEKLNQHKYLYCKL